MAAMIAWVLLVAPFALAGLAFIGVPHVPTWVWAGSAFIAFWLLVDYSVCAMSNTRNEAG